MKIILSSLRIIFNIKKVSSSADFFKSFSNKKVTTKYNYFVVIPLLREQEMISDLIKMSQSLSKNIKFVFVTTEKELTEHNNLCRLKFKKNKRQIIKNKKRKRIYRIK